MDILAFIESGLIENYCLGFCTDEEIAEVEKLAEKYPAIQSEIEKIRVCFEQQLHDGAVQPSPSVKIAVLQSVYKQQSAIDHSYAPLITNNTREEELKEWITLNKITSYKGEFENLFITELPSTNKVINFIVTAKKGHEQEVHEDFIEYLFVIEGRCVMNFNGKEIAYRAGEIISIPLHITHSAIVTSEQPMLALVQRQFCV